MSGAIHVVSHYFVKGPPSSHNAKPLICEIEVNSPPDADQDYTSLDSDDNQDDSSSQPNEHVVADDIQEPYQVVTDAILSGNSLENQNDESVDTAAGSSDTHDPVEESTQQDQSNTNAQSVVSAKAFTIIMDIMYKVEDHDSWKRANCYHVLVKLAYKVLENTKMLEIYRSQMGTSCQSTLTKLLCEKKLSILIR